MDRHEASEQIAVPRASVAQLWRFPVKSMGGERLPLLELTMSGVAGDRYWALDSSGAPPGMLRVSGAERRVLLRMVARGRAEQTRVHLPTGIDLSICDPLLLGSLASLLPGRHRLNLTASEKPQTDCRPLALISLQSVGLLERELTAVVPGCKLAPRRFRANLVLDMPPGSSQHGDFSTFPEDALVGRTIRIGGTAVIRILERDPRCRFITYDPETTEPLPELMKVLHARHNSRAGVYAAVVTPGPIREGDQLVLLPDQQS